MTQLLRSALLVAASSLACACAAPGKEPGSLEAVIADLIRDTNDLRSFHVAFELEDDAASRFDVFYERPDRGRLSGPLSGDGTRADLWIIAGVMHARGEREYSELDLGSTYARTVELDRRLFRLIENSRSAVPCPVVNLVEGLDPRVNPFDPRSSATLPWLRTLEERIGQCRFEGDEIVYVRDEAPRAHVSRRDGFPTRVLWKGRWLVRRALETDVDLDASVWEVPEPRSGARNVSLDASHASGEPLAAYRTMVYAALGKDPDRFDAATQAAKWGLFHEEAIRSMFAGWVAESERGIDAFADWVGDQPETADPTSEIEDWGRQLFASVERTREHYLASLALPAGVRTGDAIESARSIERQAAADAFLRLVEAPLQERWDEWFEPAER